MGPEDKTRAVRALVPSISHYSPALRLQNHIPLPEQRVFKVLESRLQAVAKGRGPGVLRLKTGLRRSRPTIGRAVWQLPGFPLQ